MDSLVVNELAAHYQARVLRFTPKILGSFGFHRNSATVELGGQRLFCIPYELSVSSASLLAVLSDQETEHFLERKELATKLILARKLPDAEKPEAFHIPVHLVGFQRPNHDSAYCILNLQVVRLPHELKEMLVTHFFQVDQADAFIATLADVPFEEEDIRAVFHSQYLSLLKEKAKGERLKILSYSYKKVRLFGEFSGLIPVLGERLDFEPDQGDSDCHISGTCTSLQTFPDLPGFLLLDLDQTLSLEVVKKLMKFAKTAKTPYLKQGEKSSS